VIGGQRLRSARLLLSLASLFAPALAGADGLVEPTPGHPVTIPTRLSGDRFLALPVAKGGERLTLPADSAGGTFLFADVAGRLKLETSVVPGGGDNGQKLRMADFPPFEREAAIPPPLGMPGGKILVFENKPGQMPALFKGYSGLLGEKWFAGRVWTFDYPGKRLLWRAAGDLPRHEPAHEVKLGFRKLPTGERETNFARMPVQIDGETLDFVFDTGATNVLPDDVLKQVGDGGPAERGTSFLARSQFEKWHKKHPDWRALESVRTLTGRALIQAPHITIGGFEVGPVWFTVQPDRAFHTYMASMMDKPTEGALGGSAFRQLVITVDWPNAIAVFDRPR
jgi:hypothetical protein